MSIVSLSTLEAGSLRQPEYDLAVLEWSYPLTPLMQSVYEIQSTAFWKTSQSLFAESIIGNTLCVAAINQSGKALGFASLKEISPQRIDLEYIATDTNFRGQGIGRAVLTFAEQAAREQGFTTMTLHSAQSAANFYVRCGYLSDGDPNWLNFTKKL